MRAVIVKLLIGNETLGSYPLRQVPFGEGINSFELTPEGFAVPLFAVGVASVLQMVGKLVADQPQ